MKITALFLVLSIFLVGCGQYNNDVDRDNEEPESGETVVRIEIGETLVIGEDTVYVKKDYSEELDGVNLIRISGAFDDILHAERKDLREGDQHWSPIYFAFYRYVHIFDWKIELRAIGRGKISLTFSK